MCDAQRAHFTRRERQHDRIPPWPRGGRQVFAGAQRRNARRVTALLDWNGTLNRACVRVCTAPESRFDAISVRGQGVARAFDERLLLFSRQQTPRPTGAATGLRCGANYDIVLSMSDVPTGGPARLYISGSLVYKYLHMH